jgi:hypothetical protein
MLLGLTVLTLGICVGSTGVDHLLGAVAQGLLRSPLTDSF